MADAPRVKICGITRAEDAANAEALGADFLGAIVSPGFGRTVPEGMLPELFEGRASARVAVVVDEEADRTAQLARRLGADVIQLHGDEPASVVERLRTMGDWQLWKAVRARSSEEIVRSVERYGASVDGFLIEGWKEGVVGGGGAELRLGPERVRGALPAESLFVLAGGLTPDNVSDAVARFAPMVVDVSSGVEVTFGTKDATLMEAFVRAAREGANEVESRGDR